MFKRLPVIGLLVLLMGAVAFAQTPTGTEPQIQAQTPAQDPAPAGLVDEVQGEVTAGVPGAQARKLAAKDVVYNGETVATGQKASVQVRLADGTLLSLGEQSSVEIVNAAYDPARPGVTSAVCKLGRGVFRCLTGEVAAKEPDRFRLETPLAVIGVRGTELGVSVGADAVETAVFSGGPGLVTDKEGGAPVPVLAGQGLGKARGVALGQAGAIPGRLRSLVAGVPMRMTPGGQLVPPGMFRGKPKPPRLAEAVLRASRLKGGKDAGQAGMKGSRDAAKAAAKGAKGESGGNVFKTAGEKIKNAAKGVKDAVRGSGKTSHGGESGGAVKPGASGQEQRKLKPSGREMESTGNPGGGEGKGGGGGRR
jgi:hypothetical protein